MILYTCPAQKHGASTPVISIPAGAAQALEDAGLRYEVQVVGAFKNVPFSRRGRRQQIIDLTGHEDVPVLVTDDGSMLPALVRSSRGRRIVRPPETVFAGQRAVQFGRVPAAPVQR